MVVCGKVPSQTHSTRYYKRFLRFKSQTLLTLRTFSGDHGDILNDLHIFMCFMSLVSLKDEIKPAAATTSSFPLVAYYLFAKIYL